MHFTDGKTIKLHKSILFARCPLLLDYLGQIGYNMTLLDYDEFDLVAVFIYSSLFDVESYERLVERKRSNGSDEWKLVANRFIRFAMRFEIEELDQIVLEHMVEKKYLSLDTFAPILIDSTNYLNFCALEDVEIECLRFIRANLNETIQTGAFKSFSKRILLSIVKNCIF